MEQDLLLKTLASSELLNGGRLNPEQKDRFIRIFRGRAKFLDQSRFERMTNPRARLDRLHLGQPVTVGASEASTAPDTGDVATSQLELNVKKFVAAFNTNRETFQGNIEREQLEQTLMDAFTSRHAYDMEDLAFNGDTSITGTDKRSLLLKELDGWSKISDGARVVPFNGAQVQKGIFHELMRNMPDEYVGDPDLRWIMPRAFMDDWLDELSDRETGLGDQALEGRGVAPLGIPIIWVPAMPSRLLVPSGAATSATIDGDEFGPFEVKTGVNDTIDIEIDNEDTGTATTITLSPGQFMVTEMARELNIQFAANTLAVKATDNLKGNIVLTATSDGASSEIEIDATDGQALLGLPIGEAFGSDTGDVPEGGEIWLANPKQFIFGTLIDTDSDADGVRVIVEYEKKTDQLETVMWHQADVNIENPDAIVKGTGIRRKQVVIL